jgi:hypothetical protein
MNDFQEFFSQNPLGIIIWSFEGNIKYANPAMLCILNFETLPISKCDIHKSVQFEREKEFLSSLVNSNKQFKRYSLDFLKSNKESIKMDVMTSLLRISSEKYYCSQIRIHKSKKENLKNNILRIQNEVLLKLTKSETIDSGDLIASVKEITEAATEALGCERSSVWFYTENNNSILSMDLFQRTLQKHSNGVELFAKDFPSYFNYLKEERVLGADNAHTNPSTKEFSEVYLTPLNITSMLDAPIRLHGKMVGVICNENVNEYRTWTPEELTFSASLADLISRAMEAKIRKQAEDEIKKINENLEQKIQDQTTEIRKSLNQITKLKEFQDGDYFLTSLILNPLIVNRNNSENIKTEFIVKQIKQFHFRNSTGQIGGDYCITDKIRFPNIEENFIFFLNADAMGKSMQGASGAIVVGTAIHNILWQIKNNTVNIKQTPEKWLEYTILELNNVFLTFGGSMIVSAFFGLIGEQSKVLLYSNFEHPHAILLRDGKASFIDTFNQNAKLGLVSHSNLSIEKFHLLSNDILIIGSDGKDDINISKNENERSINEDETLALNFIEECGGNIQKMENLIKDNGELIDDLSIMKVTVA